MSEYLDCSIYQHPSKSAFYGGVVFAIGIFLSYVPQHLKVITRRSSEGLSPMYLLIGSLSGFSAFINLLLVTYQVRECCVSGLNQFECVSNHVGLFQVGCQAFSYSLILILCVYLTSSSITESHSEYEKIYKSYLIFLYYMAINIVIVIYLFFVNRNFNNILLVANISGILSSVLSGIQYFPQLLTTYQLKHPGSLSIVMMLLQTPGGYLWTYSLYSQPGSHVTSWLPYFTAAFLQSILLGMCLYYSIVYNTNQLEREAILDIERENAAQQPLLPTT